ncbi:TetR/AcrR family transcriptional regulator [Lacticaseibacillus baoqingensis]|uniref:TetR/AcrR family transcriptional regulator n=1 Tax=Lacticaseibacillus baoqingensis TaxID=2486013 RepID=A0ABW4E6U1_9LACO|nr:TetR/AcrR family transcriptional regulator [Lacticaseibacillus baoqingensis]
MPLPTFNHLPADKQARVRAALLEEFSQYPLAQAQVARIVKSAGIARGAFYKYYADLNDAYRDLFGVAMQAIHQGMPARPTADNIPAYVDTIREFMARTDQSGYRRLIAMHYRYNEGAFGAQPTKLTADPQAAREWARTVLYHQTVRDIVLAPETQAARLKQLEAALLVGKDA